MTEYQRDWCDLRVGVVGLGYVGLPLAIEFSKHFAVVGFDISASRVESLRQAKDHSREVSERDLQLATQLVLSDDLHDLANVNCFIITVPTPVDDAKSPDLSLLTSAVETVAKNLKKGDLVIFESTVFPGCTENVCVPLLEERSGLLYNREFFCGYSPERINPGDDSRGLSDIVKITSGSTPDVADFVNQLYQKIIVAGTYLAPSIKVAEAAKVIENTQRDINIALMNELSMIFDRMDIDTAEVLNAASTKWNFLPFSPGLVGGHCIGVDPYYLTYEAQRFGYYPQIILAGRRINEEMSRFVASKFIKKLIKNNSMQKQFRVLIMGYTFKENCPDTRNTKVIDLIDELVQYGCRVEVFDPWVIREEAEFEQEMNFVDNPGTDQYDGIVVAVGHQLFSEIGSGQIASFGKKGCVIFDLKSLFSADFSDLRL